MYIGKELRQWQYQINGQTLNVVQREKDLGWSHSLYSSLFHQNGSIKEKKQLN